MVHRGVAQFGTASPAVDARYIKIQSCEIELVEPDSLRRQRSVEFGGDKGAKSLPGSRWSFHEMGQPRKP